MSSHDQDLCCYNNGSCRNQRAQRKNGRVLNLCVFHRALANSYQKKYQKKTKTSRARDETKGHVDEAAYVMATWSPVDDTTNVSIGQTFHVIADEGNEQLDDIKSLDSTISSIDLEFSQDDLDRLVTLLKDEKETLDNVVEFSQEDLNAILDWIDSVLEDKTRHD